MARTIKAFGIAATGATIVTAFWLGGCTGPSNHPPGVDVTQRQLGYFWRAERLRGNVLRVSLLDDTAPVEPFIGPSAGNANCTGCHSASPTGRYLAANVGYGNIRFMDVTTSLFVVVPGLTGGSLAAWNPNNTDEFVYSDGHRLLRGTISGGVIGPIPGTDNDDFVRIMPTWSVDNVIAYVRGTTGTSWRATGPTDIYTISPDGGPNDGTPLAGASGNGFSHAFPAFSPNGDWIAMSVSETVLDTFAPSDAQVRLVAANGSGVVKTLPNLNGPTPNVGNTWPTWSPNGDAIAFSSRRGGGSADLYVAAVSQVSGVDGPAQLLPRVNTQDKHELKFEWSPIRDQ
ncbi:MAG: TolB family protein [Armatimonadota bacterium]